MIIEFNALCFNVLYLIFRLTCFGDKKVSFFKLFCSSDYQAHWKNLSIFVLKSEIKSYKSDLPEILNF